MAKEPAGLRRWRLAHRAKKHKRRFVVARRRRHAYRRGRKGKGRRSSRAVPLIQTGIIAYPLWDAYKQVGFTKDLPEKMVFNLTGFSPQQGKMLEMNRAIAIGGALIVAQLVGSKIASRTGANRLMKKLSMGYLKLA
jgi:cytochrome c-type biogenesis protein CcmH/NrfG